jgi:thiol-disulfide isomerase/thioredoxin
VFGTAIPEDVMHPPKPGGRRSWGFSSSGATRLNQHFQDVGLDCQFGGRVRHAEFLVKPEAAASQWASEEVGRLVKDPQVLDDCGQSLGRDFHAEVAGASRRDMARVDFSIRVENHVSRRATPHTAFIRLYIFPIQDNAEMRVGVDMLRYARTRGEAALGEPKPCHFAHINLAAVEFPRWSSSGHGFDRVQFSETAKTHTATALQSYKTRRLHAATLECRADRAVSQVTSHGSHGVSIMHWLVWAALISVNLAGVQTAGEPRKDASPRAKLAADRLQLLQNEYEKLDQTFASAQARAKTAEEVNRLDAQFSEQLRLLANRFLELANDNPLEPVAVDAVAWILNNDATSPAGQAASELLLRHHASRKETLAAARSSAFQDACPATETLVRGLIQRTEHEDRGDLLLPYLAALLIKKADAARSLRGEGDQGIALKHRDPAIVRYLQSAKPDQLNAEARHLLEQSIESLVRDPIKNEARIGFAKKLLFEIDHLAVGKLAPDIEGKDLDGRPLRLSDYRGKVVVLKFWATWCGPCMAMLPHDRALVQRLASQPFVLLGVDSDKDPVRVRRLSDEKQILWPSWWDGGTTAGPIATAWNVSGLWGWPTIYVLDARGVIRYKGVRGQAMDDAADFLLWELNGKKPKT